VKTPVTTHAVTNATIALEHAPPTYDHHATRRCQDCALCRVRPFRRGVQWSSAPSTLTLARDPIARCAAGYWRDGLTPLQANVSALPTSPLNRFAAICGDYRPMED